MSRVELTFIDAAVREIVVDGIEIVVATADMDQILALVSHTEFLQGELAAAPGAVRDVIQGYELDAMEKAAAVTWLLGLISRHREAVKAIVAICTKQDLAWVGKLLPDRFVALLLLALEVNADFFSRMLGPLQTLFASLELPGVGPMAAPAAAPAAAASTGPAPSNS